MSKISLIYLFLVASLLYPSCEKKFTDIVANTELAVFKIYTYDQHGIPLSTGTGFFINELGDAITNVHVVDNADIAFIKDVNNNVFQINEVIEFNRAADIAKIKVNNNNNYKFNYLRIAPYDLKKGNEIFVIGNPEGLESILSTGIISSRRNKGSYTEVQFTAPISSGSSGSPIMDMKGNVIGVVTSAITDGQNLNFGTSIKILNDLEETKDQMSLSSETSTFLLNIHHERDYSIVLNSIKTLKSQTIVNMSITNLSLAWDPGTMWTEIGGDDSFHIIDKNTGKEYYIIDSSIGTSHELATIIGLGETHRVSLTFPPLSNQLPDSIDLIEGGEDGAWNFYNIYLKSNKPDLSNDAYSISEYYLQVAKDKMLNKEYVESFNDIDYLKTNIETNNRADAFYSQIQGVSAILYGDTLLAKRLFEESVKNQPNDDSYHFNLFHINNSLNNYESALNNISSAIAIKPNQHEYRRARAELNFELKQWQNILDDLTYCIDNPRGDPWAIDYLYRAWAKTWIGEDPCSDFDRAYNLTDDTESSSYIYNEYIQWCE